MIKNFIFLILVSGISFAKISLSAGSAIIDNQNQIITYQDSVEFSHNDIKITADKIIIKAINKDKKLYKTTAYGNKNLVILTKNSDENKIKAKAKIIIYDNQKNTIELRENANITQNENLFSGEKIIYDITQDKIDMQSKDNNKIKIQLNQE